MYCSSYGWDLTTELNPSSITFHFKIHFKLYSKISSGGGALKLMRRLIFGPYCTWKALQNKSLWLTHLSVHPFGPVFGLHNPSIEVDWQHVLRTCFLPGVSMSQPIICLLHLHTKVQRFTGQRGRVDSTCSDCDKNVCSLQRRKT